MALATWTGAGSRGCLLGQPNLKEPVLSAVRLPTGRVTVLLGSARMRAAVVARLDDAARCGSGHETAVARVTEPVPASPLPLREVLAALAGVPAAEADLRTAVAFPALAALLDTPTAQLEADVRAEAALAVALLGGPGAVVVDRLPAAGRGLAALAGSGAAVLVDAHDPVAALAHADAALRVADDGALSYEDLALSA